LITELRQEVGSKYKNTFYKYDEAGNRISKTVYEYQGSSITQDTTSESDFPNSSDWQLYNKEIYSRDVSGRELAIYVNDEISEYPIYGLSLIGKIKNDVPYYYYKDHLGSVRAVVNSSNSLISAQDYACPPWRDAWGNLLDGRSYQSDEGKFKFTSKERDKENNYDYFGARYYDARIGRWGQVEPLLDKFPQISPYVYSKDNSISRIDLNGLWDVKVHVYKDRSQYSYGIAILYDRSGIEKGRYTVNTQGQHRDRMKTNGDTPLGIYDIPDKNMWYSHGSKEAFGPNSRLVMIGESGEIEKSGRTDIRMHGGRQQVEGENIVGPVELKPTHGCIRCDDDDIKTLKQVTDELMKNDPDEYGGKVEVIDDLIEENGSYILKEQSDK